MTSPESGPVWKVGSLTYTRGGLAKLFTWLLWGDFALSVRDRALQGVVQLLFKRFGASDMLSGLLLVSLPSALGLLIGPVVGYQSDRLRTRWGRRIPYLLVATPFMVLGLVGLAFCPFLGGLLHKMLGSDSPGLDSSTLIAVAFCWLIFEISIVISNSVFGGLINDVVPQEVVGRFYGLFRAVSLIVGIVFFFNLMGQVETYFSEILLSVAVIFGVGFTIMCLKLREGNYPPPPVTGDHESAFTAIKNYFKDGFGQPFYLWYFACGILGNMALGPFNLYSVFYAKSVSLGLPTYGKCIALTYVFSLILSYPLGYLADRFHPLRVSLVVIGAYSLVMAFSFFLVHDATTFAIALIVHGVVAGSFNTSSASLGQRLLPRAKFAEIGSAGGVIASLCNMLLAPAVGTFLDHRNHEYRYVFVASFVLAVSSLIAFTVLNRKFTALGGPSGYRPPGEES